MLILIFRFRDSQIKSQLFTQLLKMSLPKLPDINAPVNLPPGVSQEEYTKTFCVHLSVGKPRTLEQVHKSFNVHEPKPVAAPSPSEQTDQTGGATAAPPLSTSQWAPFVTQNGENTPLQRQPEVQKKRERPRDEFPHTQDNSLQPRQCSEKV